MAAGFAAPAYAEFTLNILHINDFHSRFESITGSDSTCNAEGESKGECFGGIGRLKAALDQTRADLKAKGAEFTMELNSPRPGIKICFIRGPQGTSIEVLERGIS